MYGDGSGLVWSLIKCIYNGWDIPTPWRGQPVPLGINIERLREIIEDVNKQEKQYINSEPWEAGISRTDEIYDDSNPYT